MLAASALRGGRRSWLTSSSLVQPVEGLQAGHRVSALKRRCHHPGTCGNSAFDIDWAQLSWPFFCRNSNRVKLKPIRSTYVCTWGCKLSRAGLDKIERDGNIATNSIVHKCDVKCNSTMENWLCELLWPIPIHARKVDDFVLGTASVVSCRRNVPHNSTIVCWIGCSLQELWFYQAPRERITTDSKGFEPLPAHSWWA